MNSKQRRQAYRAMPKAGTKVTWISKVSGKVRSGVVVGPSFLHTGDHPKAWLCEGSIRSKLSTGRMAIRMAAGSVSHILVSAIQVQE